jgi:hypothetical protein
MARHNPYRSVRRFEVLEGRLLMAGDVVIQWNNVLLDAIRTSSTPPPLASRALAMTHASIYDAVNAIDRTHEAYLVNTVALPGASPVAAAAAAAHQVLVTLFPALTTTFDAALANSLAAVPDGTSEDAGAALGRFVAGEILKIRSNDGASATAPPYLGGSAPGEWRPTPPGNLPGLLPQWGNVRPFAIASPAQFRPDGIPELHSRQYTTAFNEVKSLGSASSSTRTADQTAIAHFWANGPGTSTPPGHLNVMAQVVSQAAGNTLTENARLFALLNLAEADAAISCWDAKYAHSFWRPITGIREAATDGNPHTAADPAWTPLLTTPNFPGYTSGHSTFSGAAAAILARFFGSDRFAFTLPSESAAAGNRTFTSFSQAALESANSRLYAGIHWSFDNLDGLTAGKAVGNYVFRNFLRPRELAPAADLVDGTLVIQGSAGHDTIMVNRLGSQLVVRANGRNLGSFDVAAVLALAIEGRDGHDAIIVAPEIAIDAQIHGGRGNDFLVGGAGHDRIFGDEGNDLILGLAGNDYLDGGAGFDVLWGGLGDDELHGGPGRDLLRGGPGSNLLFED